MAEDIRISPQRTKIVDVKDYQQLVDHIAASGMFHPLVAILNDLLKDPLLKEAMSNRPNRLNPTEH